MLTMDDLHNTKDHWRISKDASCNLQIILCTNHL